MFVASAALAGNGNQPTATAQNAPTFRTGVRLIEVDVFVTDREGRFVRGLTQDDAELVEDGKPQGAGICYGDNNLQGFMLGK
jgi:hypothetical protein